MKIILIRHGETEWSFKKRYCSWTDIELNERGRYQGELLSDRLSGEKIQRVYSSDMKRVFQFAQIIFRDRTIEKLQDLREINFGIFEGCTYKKIMKQYRDVYTRWIEDPVDITIPCGESLNDLAKRVRKACKNIFSSNDNGAIAVVSHGGPIKVILCDALGMDLKDIWRIEVPLASVNRVEYG